MTTNILSLEEWREEIIYHPYHFWQLSGPKAPVTSACNSTVKQYAWQNVGIAGRDEIARAIERAEDLIRPLMGFSTGPHYNEATMQWPRHQQVDIWRAGYAGADGRWINFRLPEGKILKIGSQKTTVLATANAVVYTDANGDGLVDTFTTSIPDPGNITDMNQVGLFFQISDQTNGDGYTNQWRIKPIKVTQTGGNIKITGRAWMLVRPELYEGVGVGQIDPEDMTNFVTKVDICWVYIDPDGKTVNDAQATLIWETPPYPSWALSFTPPFLTGYDPAAQAFALARVGIRDAENGEVSLGESIFDPSDNTFKSVPFWGTMRFRPPDRVLIRYLAGADFKADQRVDNIYKPMVARLAAAELNQRICACQDANKEIYRWQFDLAQTGGSNSESYTQMSAADLANPLGTRRGQVNAYKQIRTKRIFEGFAAG